MVDGATSPLRQKRAKMTRLVSGENLAIEQTPLCGKICLRGAPTEDRFQAAVRRALGVDPPGRPLTSSANRIVNCLWLAPDAWLIVTPRERTDNFIARLKLELASQHVSVVNVSDAMVVIRITGKHASDLLMKGATIDLHPTAFTTEMIIQASFVEISCIYRRLADNPPTYDLYVPSSYGEFVWDWLLDALNKMR